MHISSPYFVVSVLVAVFAICIYLGATTKEDGYSDHDGHGAH